MNYWIAIAVQYNHQTCIIGIAPQHGKVAMTIRVPGVFPEESV